MLAVDQHSFAPPALSNSDLPQTAKQPATAPRPSQVRDAGTDFNIALMECTHCGRLLTTDARVGELAHAVCQGCGRQVHQTAHAAVLMGGSKP